MTNDTGAVEGTMPAEAAKEYVNKLLMALIGCDLEYNQGAGKRYRVEADLEDVDTRVSYVIHVQRQPDQKLSEITKGEQDNGENKNVDMGSVSNTDSTSGVDINNSESTC